MSTATQSGMETVRFRTWASAMTAGVFAGVVMGLLLHFAMDMMPTIASLYGAEGVGAGWVAHLFHSVVFALVFAGIALVEPVRGYASEPPTSLGVGVTYGVALWVFGSVIMMPLWLESAGLGGPGVPNIDLMSLVGHVVFGVVLGAVHPAVLGRSGTVATPQGTEVKSWASAGIAGLGAGVVMGLMMHFVMDMMPTVAALYGSEGAAAGWAAHLFHSVVFAVIYAVVFSAGPLRSFASNFPANIATGAGYGAAIWVFGTVFMMPVWLQNIGFEYAPQIPNYDPVSLLAHILFGVFLSVTYPFVLRILRS